MIKTYRLGENPVSITCFGCGLTSYSVADVQHHFCGHCHIFHDEIPPADRPKFVRETKKIVPLIESGLRPNPKMRYTLQVLASSFNTWLMKIGVKKFSKDWLVFLNKTGVCPACRVGHISVAADPPLCEVCEREVHLTEDVGTIVAARFARSLRK